MRCYWDWIVVGLGFCRSGASGDVSHNVADALFDTETGFVPGE